MLYSQQLFFLFLLSIPIACISWTVTREEIFKESRAFCIEKSKNSKSLFIRKFFYLFTCEYCFSHYVSLAFLLLTKFQLLYDDWRGYLISALSLVWIANVYMSLFAFIRVGMKKEKMDADMEELKLKSERAKITQEEKS
jgi:hypothetical protein